MFKIKKLIRQKLFLKYLIAGNKGKFQKIKRNKRRIIIALAADYGNLGDVAITYAQLQFLKSNFPEYEIIDFPISKTFLKMKQLKNICTPQDIITIVGGGNTGDMYDDIEYCRQFIIQQIPNNRIISFPQTIDFSNTSTGKRALQRAIKVYSKHKNLTLSAREEKSYKDYKEYFPNNKVLFLPDIVLSLDEGTPIHERQDITLCLRSDGEKNIDNSQEEILIDRLKEKYDIKYYDTHINKSNLSIQERKLELHKIWTAFKKSKVVVTDRLHGMIFCAITKTPCVAIDNSNRKISGVYDAWLKNVGYIKMLKEYNLDELSELVDSLYEIDLDSYEAPNLNGEFQVINDLLKNKVI